MLIRFVWRHCHYDRIPETLRKYGVDAFFLEASLDEAEESVFPFMDPEAVSESKSLGLQYLWNGEKVLARPYCFLAARDLSYIFPESPAYPFDELRSGGCLNPLSLLSAWIDFALSGIFPCPLMTRKKWKKILMLTSSMVKASSLNRMIF